MSKKLVFVGICVLFSIFLGCGEKLPSDLPKLVPVDVTVFLDGTPLSKATVTLYPLDMGSGQSGLPVGGISSDKGVAKLKTQGRYDGSPLGKYRVCVSKSAPIEGPTSKKTPPTDPEALKAYEKKVGYEREFVNAIEKTFSDPKKSPLEIDIVDGKNTFTVEVKKAAGTPDFVD